jgi:uncharacterized protein (TIGR01440 family)
MTNQTAMKKDVQAVIDEWIATDYLKDGNLFVIGCSTSEVAGEKIGTAGTEDIAAILFEELTRLKKDTGIHLAFQGCEHINRALVVERETVETYRLEEVNVVPVPEAGGSMASFAYKTMEDPVVVESLNHQAHAGIDIGETMIGMHLRSVVVPLRFDQRYIGEARLGLARTRPKLIGGKRASYESTRK